jgi:hypothetical protein
MERLAAADGTVLGELGLELLEPALRSAAVEADGGPVPEHLAALLPKPVGGFAHASTLDWREAHERFWSDGMIADDTLVVAERFGLVERLEIGAGG